MPGWDWQLAIALLCVAGAVAFLVRRAFRLWAQRAGGCGSGGCGGCPSGDAGREPPVVPLDSLEPHRRR